MISNNDQRKPEMSVDILVIGGGGSGMTASLRAKENGARKVLLIEKNKKGA